MKRKDLSLALLVVAALLGCAKQKPADASGPAAPAAGSLGQLLGGATAVKVTERAADATGAISASSYGVADAADIQALITALGDGQAPAEGCPKCLPSKELTFEAGGAERATLGLFCGQDASQPQIASLRTPAGACQNVTLKDPEAVKQVLQKHAKPASK